MKDAAEFKNDMQKILDDVYKHEITLAAQRCGSRLVTKYKLEHVNHPQWLFDMAPEVRLDIVPRTARRGLSQAITGPLKILCELFDDTLDRFMKITPGDYTYEWLDHDDDDDDCAAIVTTETVHLDFEDEGQVLGAMTKIISEVIERRAEHQPIVA